MIYWSKTRPDAIIPTKRSEDAGYDLYPCFDEDYIIIHPQETKIIGTGVASAFPQDKVMFLKERSSTGMYGLSLRSGVIDSGYRGEYKVAITNVSDEAIAIVKEETMPMIEDEYYMEKVWETYGAYTKMYPYTKAICQAVLLDLAQEESKEIPYEELLKMESERGTGWSGSSGK